MIHCPTTAHSLKRAEETPASEHPLGKILSWGWKGTVTHPLLDIRWALGKEPHTPYVVHIHTCPEDWAAVYKGSCLVLDRTFLIYNGDADRKPAIWDATAAALLFCQPLKENRPQGLAISASLDVYSIRATMWQCSPPVPLLFEKKLIPIPSIINEFTAWHAQLCLGKIHPARWPFSASNNRLVKKRKCLKRSQLRRMGSQTFWEAVGLFYAAAFFFHMCVLEPADVFLFGCMCACLLACLQGCPGSPESTLCSFACKEAKYPALCWCQITNATGLYSRHVLFLAWAAFP